MISERKYIKNEEGRKTKKQIIKDTLVLNIL